MTGPAWTIPAAAAAAAADATAARDDTDYGDAPVDSGITQIQDHADRAVALLPRAHTRDNWTVLMQALLGRRGAWADETTLYAVDAGSTSPAVQPFVCPSTVLETVFGAGGATTVRASATLLQEAPSAALGDVTLYRYAGATVALAVTGDVVQTMLTDHDLREITDATLTDAQVIAVVEAELGGAPSGLQELEGVLWQELLLRRLALGYGQQLDDLGELLGLTRDTMTDADYRDALRWKAALNVSNGTIEEILVAAAALDGVVQAQLLEAFPATMTLYLHGTMATAGLRRIIEAMPKEGVCLALVSADGERPFVFGPEAGWHAVVSISGADITVFGDATDYFAAGDRVRVWRVAADEVALDDATVTGTALSAGNTVVSLTKTFGGVPPGASNPLILESITDGLQDADGYGFEDAYLITGIDQGGGVITVDGDGTAEWAAGQLLEIVGSTGNDGAYSVAAVGLSSLGDTEITVDQALASAVADGQLLHLSPGRAAGLDPTLTGDDSLHGELADHFVD